MAPMRWTRRSLLPLVLATVMAGCASSGGGGGRNLDVITSEELGGLFVADLYQAIERLRPQWLSSRGARAVSVETIIAVVVDGNFLGGVEVLRQIPVPNAIEIRHMDAAEATATIRGIVGSARVIEGAIIVSLGRNSR